MKLTKSILMGTGGIVLAGLILTLLAPKAAHAIAGHGGAGDEHVRYPVAVQNVLPGKPFFQSCEIAADSCRLSPPVPAGFTFVVQHTNTRVFTPSAPAAPKLVVWTFATQGNEVLQYEIAVPLGSGAFNDSQVAWYVDSNTIPGLFTLDGGVVAVQATLTGYLTQ